MEIRDYTYCVISNNKKIVGKMKTRKGQHIIISKIQLTTGFPVTTAGE
jgi:hypothetical protein